MGSVGPDYRRGLHHHCATHIGGVVTTRKPRSLPILILLFLLLAALATPLTNTSAINHEANWTYLTIQEDAGNGASCSGNDIPSYTIIPIGDFVANDRNGNCISFGSEIVRFHTIVDESVTSIHTTSSASNQPDEFLSVKVSQGISEGFMCSANSDNLGRQFQVEYDSATNDVFRNDNTLGALSCSITRDANQNGAFSIIRRETGPGIDIAVWDSTNFQRTPTNDFNINLQTAGSGEITHGVDVGQTPPDYRSENTWNTFAASIPWDNNTQTNITFPYFGEDLSIMTVNCFVPWDETTCQSADTSNATLKIRKVAQFNPESQVVRNVVYNDYCRGLITNPDAFGTDDFSNEDPCGIGVGYSIANVGTEAGRDSASMSLTINWDATENLSGLSGEFQFRAHPLNGKGFYDNEEDLWVDELGVRGWRFRDLCAYGTPAGGNAIMAWEAQDPASSATKILAAITTPANDANWTKPFIVTEGDDWGDAHSVHIRSQGNCAAYNVPIGKVGVIFHVDDSTNTTTDVVVGISQVQDFDLTPFIDPEFDADEVIDEDEITSIQEGDSYLGIDLVNISEQWDTTLQSIQFITAAGIIAIFVVGIGVTLGFVGAVIGLALGIAVAFGMGLLPLWMILILVMFIAFLTGVIIFGGRAE